MNSRALTFAGMLETNAQYRANAPAIVFAQRSLTFSQLFDRARRIASGLVRLGLARQDRVAILAQNCPEFCEAYSACEWAGLIAATVNFRLAAPEVAFVLQDSGASVLIVEQMYLETIESIRKQLPSLKHVIVIGTPPPGGMSFEDLAALGDSAGPNIHAREDDIAFLIYTSGTTGRPKGCMIGQRNEIERARITSLDISATAQDRILLTMPLFHIGAKAMLTALHWVGGTAHIQREFRPRQMLEAIQRERITVGHLAPTMVQMLVEDPDAQRFDLSSLRMLVYSASQMPSAVLSRGLALLGPIFHQIYGLTEGVGTSLAREYHRLDGDERTRRRLKSIGLPSPGIELRITDAEGRDCAVEEAGEILLRSATLTLGYWNNSAATLEALRDGWLHTGDVGRRDADGFIYLVDRKKDMIISGGENIYSREVEEALYQHPDVAEAAVIGVPDATWGESVRAVIARRQGADVSAAELTTHIRALIASYKKPKSIVFVNALPKMPSGKIDKITIRMLYGDPQCAAAIATSTDERHPDSHSL